VIVISDTNVLSSLAAGNCLLALSQLYKHAQLIIPPTVRQELQEGLDRGKTHLQPVIQAIAAQEIEVVSLSAEEELRTFLYPANLDAGEREAIALAQTRKALLLSNDGDAIRYGRQRKLNVVSLPNLLRLFLDGGSNVTRRSARIDCKNRAGRDTQAYDKSFGQDFLTR
jgi:predicted nucleic acid-binding protein